MNRKKIFKKQKKCLQNCSGSRILTKSLQAAGIEKACKMKDPVDSEEKNSFEKRKKLLTKALRDANIYKLTHVSDLASRLHHEIKDFGCAA